MSLNKKIVYGKPLPLELDITDLNFLVEDVCEYCTNVFPYSDPRLMMSEKSADNNCTCDFSDGIDDAKICTECTNSYVEWPDKTIRLAYSGQQRDRVCKSCYKIVWIDHGEIMKIKNIHTD